MSATVRSCLWSLALAAAAAAQHPAAYVHSQTDTAWGWEAAYTTALATLFDGQVNDVFYESADIAALLAPSRVFVYLEGSDDMADELETFLDAHRDALEDWVKDGGRLFVNCAPNDGDGMTLPFDVTLLYEGTISDLAVPAGPDAPFLLSPVPIVATTFAGDSASHARLSGKGLEPLLRDDSYALTLAGSREGKGRAFFGGLTTPNFWSGEGPTLRDNTLAFISGRQLDPEDVSLSMKLTAPGETPKDSIKLKIKNWALGDVALDGASMSVSIDGVDIPGILDEDGKSESEVGGVKTGIAVKAGNNGSLKLTVSNADLVGVFDSPFLAPIDTDIELHLPIVITFEGLEFVGVVPVSFNGRASSSSKVKSL